MRSFLGLPNDSRQRDSSVVNTLVDGKSCVSSSRIGSDRCESCFVSRIVLRCVIRVSTAWWIHNIVS
jgi:hypothetical protein